MSEPKCCSLSHQELHAAVRELSAEVAALRETLSGRTFYCETCAATSRELEQARALLARVSAETEATLADYDRHENICITQRKCLRDALDDTRAFLRSDEARGAPECPSCKCGHPFGHGCDADCPDAPRCTARAAPTEPGDDK